MRCLQRERTHNTLHNMLSILHLSHTTLALASEYTCLYRPADTHMHRTHHTWTHMTHARTHTHTRTRTHTHTHAHARTRVHTHTHAHTYAHTHARTHTYTHTRTHAHTHTHLLIVCSIFSEPNKNEFSKLTGIVVGKSKCIPKCLVEETAWKLRGEGEEEG